MYKRILVPLDGSPFSEEVIPYAAGVAAVHGTELVLLRIAEKLSDEEDAREYIKRVASIHGAHGLCVVGTGDAAQAVLTEASRVPETLLAMTSRGHSGLMELVLGSVAKRIVRGAGRPVLVYHPTGARNPDRAPVKLHSVVLPLDGSPLSEAMASDAAKFALWIDASLEVVSAIQAVNATKVGEVSGAEMSMLESGYVHSQATQLSKQHGVRVDWDVLHGDPVAAIVDHVARRSDVILAMTTQRKDALEAALLGSVTSGCLRKAGVPILMRLP
ncbi:MAG TPA: universal stress protein [Spongiibacteraceae bacterium]|nr:universal stress protein [Spongiibacteraceae bacterium]